MSKVMHVTDQARRERLTGNLATAAGLYRIAAALATRNGLLAMAETAARHAVECELIILATITD